MKSPGVIYRKYRQIRRKLLYDKIQEARRWEHRNCVYGKMIEVTDKSGKHSIPICLYNKNLDKGLDVCSNPIECNAFINKNSKESVEVSFNAEIKDINIRSRKYPELNILDWVLDKNLEEAKKSPSILVKIAITIIELLENFIKSSQKDEKTLMDR
jgi:hypothetical protein